MNAVAQPSALQVRAQDFLARYEGLKDRLPGDAAVRTAAAAAFARTGLPGPREEAWRYTSLRPLAEIGFREPLGPLADCAALLAGLPAIEGPRLVFVDGRFRADLSAVPSHVTVRTGTPAFGTLARLDEKLVTLNTMLAEDGATIDVAEGIDAGTLLLISLGSGSHSHPVAFHPRHALHLSPGASMTLIEIAMGAGTYLHNPVTSITVDAAATLTHLRIQNESPDAFHLSTVYADVGARGTYDSFALTLGGRLARMEVHAHLHGEKAAAHLNAAQLLGGNQHADFTTVVAHDAPATASRQTVKNVLTGHARGVFQGKIEVARVAQKTDGYQMNQALLLSPDAEIDSKPQLEIYADDVKCSHGATVGDLDPDQLFYLRSRGVAQAEARSILVRAFLSEALDPIVHEEARAAMETAITAWWERQSV
ncbi:Fe-S cluster assembly protein SufD [Limobrevibacterium gyesilva]|uniref:Fe-S cluster assembly protein SufD n=1 Tax=Limobrevibacterium gyesilva TaxID=2991712 RepID=A0AA41YQJ9_9PROT|nr:Fe-S cluster assembly protein SufD [Limobrevibacterium gyesilva]MCW3476458.1 Fe-S cluster assembly protein SufD [Limobrevibacterium gyesilva]